MAKMNDVGFVTALDRLLEMGYVVTFTMVEGIGGASGAEPSIRASTAAVKAYEGYGDGTREALSHMLRRMLAGGNIDVTEKFLAEVGAL